MSAILDELFCVQTGETTCQVQAYSDLLNRVVDSCPGANVVRESQQWSRLAAIQSGGTIHGRDEVAGEELPFNPIEVAVQVTYFWDVSEERYDLAFVATWEYDAE